MDRRGRPREPSVSSGHRSFFRSESTVLAFILIDLFLLSVWYSYCFSSILSLFRNWPFAQKVIVTIAICIYTFAVYMASSIYTASIPQLIEHFDISHTQAIGGLSIYIFAYGIGPLILSPLSEIPAIGRNGVYIPTAILFTLLSIVTALSPNYSTLMVSLLLNDLFFFYLRLDK